MYNTYIGYIIFLQYVENNITMIVPSLMSGFSTPMPPQINSPLPLVTENTRTAKSVTEQRVGEIERGSFTPLVLFLTVGLGNAAKFAIVDSPQCLLPNVINHTVAPCPG